LGAKCGSIPREERSDLNLNRILLKLVLSIVSGEPNYLADRHFLFSEADGAFVPVKNHNAGESFRRHLFPALSLSRDAAIYAGYARNGWIA
jgi:hypothetical protein